MAISLRTDFAFNGPDGAELDYEGVQEFFASFRAAFDELTISRGIMVVEADSVACQTTITRILCVSSRSHRSVRFLRIAAGSCSSSPNLPIRRPRTTRGGMDIDRQPTPAAPVGR
jgi:hypothetical protein